ncbi:VanW family protein [Propionicicella superfundia]|uniref:VanW family protein n=1 Tax=Propionicicella superfundia TaxID=348582 RepID=UPI0003FAF545|nr:VanW family protein [Propionicicella superfundia]
MSKAKTSGRTSRRVRVVALSIGGVIVLAGGAYLAGYFLVGDNLPANTVVEGVKVGGLSRDQAVAKLESELAATTDPQLTLTADDVSVTQAASAWGLTPDYEGSVDAAQPSRSLDPTRIWYALTGGGSFELLAKADEPTLDTTVAAFAAKADRDAADATITYKDATPAVTNGRSAVSVDTAETKTALADAYLQTTSVTAAATVTEPDVTTAEAQETLTSFAEPAVSGNITVTVSGRKLTITPAQIASATGFSAQDSALVGKVDYTALLKALQSQISELGLAKAQDASFTFSSGKPVVVPSKDGVELTADALSKAVDPVVTASGSARTATAQVTGKKADLTTEEAQNLGIKEITGEFTTYFPGQSYRFTNIGLAAKGINGSLVLQGETWSLNDTLGERTTAKGYVPGSYIAGSTLREVVGGGISQSATTTYNAIFFAGLKDVEHHPHSLYFSRYPVAREATVSWGSLDLKFQNDSKYGVLMQAYISRLSDGSGSITVRVWSTKTYDVKATDAVKGGYSYGTTRYDTSSNCVGQSATPGFTATYKRLFYQSGNLVKSESFTWTYDAGDRVICGSPPKS